MHFMREYPVPKDQMGDIEAMVEAGDVEEVRRAINAAFFDGFLCAVGIDWDIDRLTAAHLYVTAVDAAKANEKVRRKWDFK